MRFILSAVRIAIAVAIINGVGRTALVYWSHYQFQDAAQQLAILGSRSSPEVLRSSVLDKATNLLIPITEEQIVVTREGQKVYIAAAYENPVEYFPHRSFPLKLAFRVEGVNFEGAAH